MNCGCRSHLSIHHSLFTNNPFCKLQKYNFLSTYAHFFYIKMQIFSITHTIRSLHHPNTAHPVHQTTTKRHISHQYSQNVDKKNRQTDLQPRRKKQSPPHRKDRVTRDPRKIHPHDPAESGLLKPMKPHNLKTLSDTRQLRVADLGYYVTTRS